MRAEWYEMPFSQAVLLNPSVELTKGAEYPFVDMQSVNADSRCVYASEMRPFSGGGARFSVGDTLMARITPCLENGKIARFCSNQPERFGHGSTEFIVIRGRENVTLTEYAYYLAKWDGVSGYAISQMTGTSGRQRVPTNCFDHLLILVPPLSEQRAIAHVLGTLDDKIEVNRRMNETLEAMARAIFKSWFVDFDPIRAKAEGRQPYGMDAVTAALFPDSFHDSPLDKIPMGWHVTSLGDHVEAVRGLSYAGKGLSEAGIPLHNLNSVLEGGGYKYEGIKRYIGEYEDRHVIRPGDLVVANTEQGFDFLLIGFPAIVPKCYGEFGLFSHHLFRVRPKTCSPVRTHFLYWLIISPAVRAQIVSCTNGTTVNMLAPDGLERPRFILPPPSLIEVFERVAAPLHERTERNREESVTLGRLRDFLLPKLVSGEIRVKDIEKTPASL